MSDHVSGHEDASYMYGSPALKRICPSVPDAIFSQEDKERFSAILPEDVFRKSDADGEEHHQASVLQTAWMKIKQIFNFIWNGPHGGHGEGEHH